MGYAALIKEDLVREAAVNRTAIPRRKSNLWLTDARMINQIGHEETKS
jgi:hypothetical protein